MKISPIVLFVYNRLWHTRQTIEALQKNELASQSELFIYADGARNENEIDQVFEVRCYIEEVEGFKKVTITERDKNWGLANSIINGVTQIVNKYGRVIVLEDDLVTSPFFLRYMNDALDIYKDNNEIEDRTIDSHVKRIRKKFKMVDQNFSAIETRYGSGYRWNVN